VDLGQANASLADASLDASLDAAAEAASLPAPLPLGPFVATDGEPWRGVIAAEFARPGDERSHVELAAGGARKLALGPGEGELIAVPFRLVYDTYAGKPAKLTNRYCGFAAIRFGTSRSRLAGYWDTCSAMRKLAEVDLNHDGIPDFIFVVTVRSNRYPEDVEEGAVFLSNRGSMTYCFADVASGTVTIGGRAGKTFTGAAAIHALEEQIRRRGAEETLACTTQFGETYDAGREGR
jgi:hypothetical protein